MTFTDLEEQKNAAYAERDRLVAALSKVFPAHLARHEGAEWEDDWRNIACIHLPAGQAAWHIHDSELPWFAHLEMGDNHWDGHSTPEKYERLARLRAAGVDEIKIHRGAALVMYQMLSAHESFRWVQPEPLEITSIELLRGITRAAP